MRKITEQIVRAFRNGEAARIGNSRTDGRALYLHENKIAEFRNQELWITNAGWTSRTTKERLNGLPLVSIYQERGAWYLNGREWGGEWVQATYGLFRDGEEEEVEYDVTSRWTGKYSAPVYSVYHTHNEGELEGVEKLLGASGIVCRRIESDTVGEYMPNYFIVVLPADLERAKRLTEES
jgi:hypothetical protein